MSLFPQWLDLDLQTLTALIIGGVVVLIIVVLSVRSLLSSRLVVIVGGVLAVGAIAPGVLGALGNLIGGLLGGLIPLAVIVIGGAVALLTVLKRNPDLREWLRPLLPRRSIEPGLPPTSVETSAWQPHRYTVIDMPRRDQSPTRRAKRRNSHLRDWGF